MFKILDKYNGEVTAEQQAVFNKISTNNADGYVDGFLNSLRIAKLSSNMISIDSGLLSIQGFRSVNTDLATYTVSVTPSEPIPFQLIATYSHYTANENDTLEITTRPVQELRREPLFSGQNAVYEVELAEFTMTSDGITDFTVTLEKIVYNEQDISELMDKVTTAEKNSSTAIEKVDELEKKIVEKQGTAVIVGGVVVADVVFDSDPQTQLNDKYSAKKEPPYPVTSVDGKTGAVTLSDLYAGKNATETALAGKLDKYAVGDFYITASDTNPAEKFGGTWTKIADKFLVGAGGKYANGSSGGEETHLLTVSEMPSHNHEENPYGVYTGTGIVNAPLNFGGGQACSYNEEVSPRRATEVNGGSQPHNNIPPYLAVNIWRKDS